MNLLANWKIYAAFAAVIVLFYFMYTAKLSENAMLKSANETLTETVKSERNLSLLKDNVIKTQENLLAANREVIRVKSMELGSIEKKLEERSDSSDAAHPYLKELFKEIGKVK